MLHEEDIFNQNRLFLVGSLLGAGGVAAAPPHPPAGGPRIPNYAPWNLQIGAEVSEGDAATTTPSRSPTTLLVSAANYF